MSAALREIERLKQENERLKQALTPECNPRSEIKKELSPRAVCLPTATAVEQVVAPADKLAKIALFRSLFRGRDDVYAIRWQMKNGMWGYRPDDKKDWKAVLARKPKKTDRETRTFYPLTDDVIRSHLEGKRTIGVYPLTAETCWFLAADFDKTTWQEDALAFVATCHTMGLHAYLERSRSGNGGHAWLFFEYAVPAVVARKMGCAVLTRMMNGQLGLDSYDRFFPNQDTIPKGGFGNLIPLPLQWAARQAGNSVFVDDDLGPYGDRNSQIVRARTQTRRRIGRPICLACSPRISSSARRQ